MTCLFVAKCLCCILQANGNESVLTNSTVKPSVWVGALSWSDWNLEMLVFVDGGKPEKPEKPDKNPRSKARTKNKLNPHMAPGRNRTRATSVGGESSRHCAIHAPYISY